MNFGTAFTVSHGIAFALYVIYFLREKHIAKREGRRAIQRFEASRPTDEELDCQACMIGSPEDEINEYIF
jgi:hypothetical protein